MLSPRGLARWACALHWHHAGKAPDHTAAARLTLCHRWGHFGNRGTTLAGRFLESLVSGAKSFDPATFAFSAFLLLLTAAASIWTATRRIVRLDIMDILRFE